MNLAARSPHRPDRCHWCLNDARVTTSLVAVPVNTTGHAQGPWLSCNYHAVTLERELTRKGFSFKTEALNA